MKNKLSITMDQDLILALFEKIRQSKGTEAALKNKSQAIEMAVKRFVEAE